MNKQLQAKVDKAIDKLCQISGDISELQDTLGALIDEAYDEGCDEGYKEGCEETEKKNAEV